jgi:hypothetical protein
MNSRKPPAITISAHIPKPVPHYLCGCFCEKKEANYHGLNRPEQTGEEKSNGFRTSIPTDGNTLCDTPDGDITPMTFIPNASVTSPNEASANRTVTTHADRY